MKPQNFEEKVVWYCLLGTYLLYFIGAQFVVIPIVAWILLLYLGKKKWSQTDQTPNEQKVYIPLTTWVWVISMLFMGFTIILGQIDFNLGSYKVISSTVNSWARQWALFALFPLTGCLNIRPQLICRAVCILCLQNIFFVGISYLLCTLHIEVNYISPLYYLGGNYQILYGVDLYDFDFDAGNIIPRLKLFAPWCPELGMVGNLYFFLTSQEANKKWRWFGMIVSVIMVISTISRSAILCIPSVMILSFVLAKSSRPITQFTIGVMSFVGGIVATQVIDAVNTFKEQFDSYRAGSSKERETLFNLALTRWTDAPIWGHAAVQGFQKTPGIGTHHTWAGLLFVRGLVGLTAFTFPLVWSFMDLLFKAQKSTTARQGLSVVLVLFVFGFVIDVSYIAHLYWPGLIMIGIAFKEKSVPLRLSI